MPLTFKEKIDQIKAHTGKTINALNKESGLGQGTLQKAYEKNSELSSLHMVKFLNYWHVNSEWWSTGKGEIIMEKGTSVENKNESRAEERLIKSLTDQVNMQSEMIRDLRSQRDRLQNQVDKLEGQIAEMTKEMRG